MIVAVCMARNEADYIGQVIDHLWHEGVDLIVVEDGTSTDDTIDVCEHHGAEVVREKDRVYDQPARMAALTADWCAPGDWVVPFDADEFWHAHDQTLAAALNSTTAVKCWARMFEHRDLDYRRPDPKPLPKVAYRWLPGTTPAFGNHSVPLHGEDAWGLIDLREWQYRSYEHFVAKVDKQRDLLTHTPNLGQYGTHKNALVDLSESELAAEWERMRAGEWVYDPIPVA